MASRGMIALALALAAVWGCQLDEGGELGSSVQAIKGGDGLPDADFTSVCSMVVELPLDPMNPEAERDPRQCSCVLIGADVVITSAHCVAENIEADALDDINLVFGGDRTGGTRFAVLDGQPYRYYDEDQSFTRHDLALLRIDVMDEAPSATPATLNVRPLSTEDVELEVILVGFGFTDDEADNFGTRRAVTTTIRAVDNRSLVAGTEEEATCIGDAGGGVFADFGDGPVLIAITSRSVPARCSGNHPRLRVDRYLHDFIDAFECRAPDAGCEPCSWDGECVQDCPTRDWDCELGTFVGEACALSGECEEGGRCLAAEDDDTFTYCTRRCTLGGGGDPCPGSMQCVDDGDGAGECVYGTPSPGSQGFACNSNLDCRSGICEERICVNECGAGGACPEGFSCGPSSVQPGTEVCLGRVFSGGGGFCAIGAHGAAVGGGGWGGGALALLALGLLLAGARRLRPSRA